MAPCISSTLMHQWFARLDRDGVAVRLDRGQIDLAPDTDFLTQAVSSLGSGAWSYPSGSQRLLAAVRSDLRRTRGWSSDKVSIIATHGAIGGLDATFRALCTVGDDVLLPMPIWPPLVDMVRSAGAVPRFYPFESDADVATLCDNIVALQASCRRPRVLLLNAPHNPTGLCLTANARDAVFGVASALDLIVVSDEAYEGLGCPCRIDRMMTEEVLLGGRGVLVLSMSKRFGSPGLRLGFVCAAEPLFSRIRALTQMQTGGISSLVQTVGIRLFEEGAALEQHIRSAISDRRACTERALQREGVALARDRAGFYVMLPLPDGTSGWDAADALRGQGIGVVPGEIFGQKSAVRLTLGVDAAELERLAPRIAREVRGR